jgi:pyruvate-ferredoxin/flavodoxin oxidoreductase
VVDYMMMENRFKMLTKSKPALAKEYMKKAEENAVARWNYFKYLSEKQYDSSIV